MRCSLFRALTAVAAALALALPGGGCSGSNGSSSGSCSGNDPFACTSASDCNASMTCTCVDGATFPVDIGMGGGLPCASGRCGDQVLTCDDDCSTHGGSCAPAVSPDASASSSSGSGSSGGSSSSGGSGSSSGSSSSSGGSSGGGGISCSDMYVSVDGSCSCHAAGPSNAVPCNPAVLGAPGICCADPGWPASGSCQCNVIKCESGTNAGDCDCTMYASGNLSTCSGTVCCATANTSGGSCLCAASGECSAIGGTTVSSCPPTATPCAQGQTKVAACR